MFLKKIIFCGLTIFIFSIILNSGLIAQARQIDRIVAVTAVADEEYIDFYGENKWKDRVRRIIERASLAFEKFGIAFEVIEFKEWQSEEYGCPKLSGGCNFYTHTYSEQNEGHLTLPKPFMGKELDPCLLIKIGRYCELALLFELKEEVKPENADIVVAFTGQPDLGFITGKVDNILGRYVLIIDAPATLPWFAKKHSEALKLVRTQKNSKKKEKNLKMVKEWFSRYRKFMPERLIDKRYDMSHLLIHELGHIFGAVHTEEDSVMKVPSTTTNRFDPGNTEIIINNKWRKFK